MREVIIALIILGIVITFAGISCVHNRALYDDMLSFVQIAGDAGRSKTERREAVLQLYNMWEENVERVQATAGRRRTESAGQALLRVRAASDTGDGDTFAAELAVLRDALKELREKEGLGLRAII